MYIITLGDAMENNQIIVLLLIIIAFLSILLISMPNFEKTDMTDEITDNSTTDGENTTIALETSNSVSPDSITVELPELDTKYTKTVGEYTVEAEKWEGGTLGGFGVWLYKNGQLVDHDSYLSRAYFYMDGEWKWSDWGNGEDDGTYHKYPVSNDVKIQKIEVKF